MIIRNAYHNGYQKKETNSLTLNRDQFNRDSNLTSWPQITLIIDLLRLGLKSIIAFDTYALNSD